jgi:hypothetical protein
MKKNRLLYGLFNSHIVPRLVWSATKLQSSCCLVWQRGMSFPGRDAGAPGLRSIIWSHILDGGNSWDASSENTLA